MRTPFRSGFWKTVLYILRRRWRVCVCACARTLSPAGAQCSSRRILFTTPSESRSNYTRAFGLDHFTRIEKIFVDRKDSSSAFVHDTWLQVASLVRVNHSQSTRTNTTHALTHIPVSYNGRKIIYDSMVMGSPQWFATIVFHFLSFSRCRVTRTHVTNRTKTAG